MSLPPYSFPFFRKLPSYSCSLEKTKTEHS